MHHKSQWNWNQPIEGTFPQRFTRAVLRPYLQAFRPVLVQNRRVQTFYVNNHGQPFSRCGLTSYYHKM